MTDPIRTEAVPLRFDDFVQHRLDRLLRYATALTCDPHLAQDVVQEVLLRAQPRWDRIATLRSPDAYVRRMVTNEYLSWRRRRAARQVATTHEALDALSSPEPDHATRYAERDAMRARIATLPRKQRSALVLRYYENLTDAEIAEALGCGESTVQPHLPCAVPAARRRIRPRRPQRLREGGPGMTDDRTESLIRDALAHEANRAVDPNVVRNQLARSARAPRRRGPALIAATVAGVAGVTIAVTAIVVPGTGQEPDHSMPAAEQSVSEPTLVIAGMDANGQSDTVLLSRVRSDGVAVVSLPRDAWVEVPGHGQQRLSTAYQLGRQAALDAGQSEEDADRKGATTLVDTVATLTGESVDHYALVDTAAVGAVTTAIGGVEVCLHEAHHDPLSGVDLDAGRQTVSGDQALAFLRQRRDLPEGDLDRMTRLQSFGESLFHSLADSEDAFTTVAGALDGHVRTDENLDVLGLAEKLASMSDPGLTTATIPIADPELTAPGGMAVIGVEEDEVREFVGAFLDGETPEGTTPELRPTSEPRCVN